MRGKNAAVTGRCGRKIGCEQADNFKMGNRWDTSRYTAVKEDGIVVQDVSGRLIDFDVDVKEIQEIIEKTDERTEEKIDWTEAWGKKYPILIRYQDQVDIQKYATQLELILNALKAEYEYNDLDTFLVLKDILAKLWGSRKK